MWSRQTLPDIGAIILLYIAFYVFGRHIAKYADQYVANTFNCSREMSKLNIEKARQDDAKLIYAIKQCYMEPPSRLPYNLKQSNRQTYAQAGQDEFVDNVLNHKVSLFFIIYHIFLSTLRNSNLTHISYIYQHFVIPI